MILITRIAYVQRFLSGLGQGGAHSFIKQVSMYILIVYFFSLYVKILVRKADSDEVEQSSLHHLKLKVVIATGLTSYLSEQRS